MVNNVDSEKQTELFLKILMPTALFLGPVLMLILVGIVCVDIFVFKLAAEDWKLFVLTILMFTLIYATLFWYCKKYLGYFSEKKIKKHFGIFILIPVVLGIFIVKDFYETRKIFLKSQQINKNTQP